MCISSGVAYIMVLFACNSLWYYCLQVNNAGIAHYLLGCDTSEEEYDQTFEINVKAHFMLTKSAVEYLKQTKGILWKESLNSDDQQFHQYQQNEQSFLLFTYSTQKDHHIWRSKFRSWLGTGTQNVAGLNWLMGSPSYPLNDCISNCNAYTTKRYKSASYYILMLSFNATSQIKIEKFGYFSFNLSSFLHSGDKTAISLLLCNAM